MKVKDVLRYNDIMKNLIDNSSLPAKVKFRFLNMCKQFEPVVENVNKVRDEALRKYAETREDGTYGIFVPEQDKFESEDAYNNAVKKFKASVKSFEADMKPVEDEDVNIEFTKFSAEEIMDAGLPADVLLAIYDLIEQ